MQKNIKTNNPPNKSKFRFCIRPVLTDNKQGKGNVYCACALKRPSSACSEPKVGEEAAAKPTRFCDSGRDMIFIQFRSEVWWLETTVALVTPGRAWLSLPASFRLFEVQFYTFPNNLREFLWFLALSWSLWHLFQMNFDVFLSRLSEKSILPHSDWTILLPERESLYQMLRDGFSSFLQSFIPKIAATVGNQ